MSLLMEALKKAEQAKRKATEGTGTPSPLPKAPAALALELSPADATPAKPEPMYATETAPSTPAPALTAAAFTLMTGRSAEGSPPATSPPPDAPPAPRQAEVIPSYTPTLAAQPTNPGAAGKPELSLDTKAPPARAVPVARSLPLRRRIPTVWITGGIALVFVLAGGGYWYYNSMAQYLTQQATLGAPQTPLVPATAVTAAPPLALVTPAPTNSVVTKTAPRTATKATPVSKPLSAAPTPKSRQDSPVAAAVPAPVAAVPNVAPTAFGEVAVSVPVPPPAPISISRDAEQNDTFVALQTAYRAYQSGDDSNAQKLYARVLGRDEHNRDALLGLAAIAVRQKDFVRAQEIYSELLTLDPKDSVAQAGFVSVTSSFDPLQQEARIKALLEQEPGAPHLLFTYASFLMQQQRWLEATRTLQSAYQAQRDNADYAFNLAVSFDHLGQADVAVKYYRAALDLAAKQSTSFRPDDVRRRLKAMSATDGGGLAP